MGIDRSIYPYLSACLSIYPSIYLYVYIHRERDFFIIRIGSHDNGGSEVPRPAVFKLENQKSPWYDSVQIPWRPENQGC